MERRLGRTLTTTSVVLLLAAGCIGALGSLGGARTAGASPVGPHIANPCSGSLPPGSVVGMAALPDASGYWIANSTGQVVACGDAPDIGSIGFGLNKPIVGIAATPSGQGYWLVSSDGGVFTFGDAGFYGWTGAIHLNQPIVGMAHTFDGRGYWLVAADGGVFSFGDPGSAGRTAPSG